MDTQLTRRDFLSRGGAAAIALPLLGGPALAARKYRTKHVVLVVLGGGVRSRDTIGTPTNIPNLMRFKETGVICPNLGVRARGHFVSALSILEGTDSTVADAPYARGDSPTVFEYVRKARKLAAGAAWLSSTAGEVRRGLAFSAHAEYGERYGANLVGTEGIFNAEFRQLVSAFGRPGMPGAAELKAGEKLRAALAPAAGGAAPADADRRMHRYIVQEVARENARLTGPGAGDEATIRVATSVLKALRPTILGIVLQNADIAHGSFDSYVKVIRRNDAQLGALWDAVQSDPDLRDTTTMMVLPEFGRNRALSGRGGLDHNDNSPDLLKVAMFAAGPDFAKGKVVRREMMAIDVCPTVCRLLATNPEFATGRVMMRVLSL